MYSRDAGIGWSVLAGVIAAVPYYGRLCLASRGEFRKGIDSAHIRELRGVKLMLSLALGGAVFCLVFTILNPLVQLEQVTKGQIREQWRDGSVILRLSTLGFTWTMFRHAHAYITYIDKGLVDVFGDPEGKEREFDPDVRALKAQMKTEDRLLRDVLQSAIFAGALTGLWVTWAHNYRDVWTAVLAWAFAFFSDDWAIISGYSRVIKGRLLRLDRLRIAGANVALLAPLTVLVLKDHFNVLAFSWVISMGALLALRYRWRFWVVRD
jgi:hypothetical protein